ncbi:MAG: HNH endonuclease family protein [Bryobacteraceae bacterium]
MLPQTPDSQVPWRQKVNDADGNVVRIGNPVVIPELLNSEAGIQPFGNKKAIYRKHNLRMIQEICVGPDWTPKQIEERNERLAAFGTT